LGQSFFLGNVPEIALDLQLAGFLRGFGAFDKFQLPGLGAIDEFGEFCSPV
jgi:hypothetical protein